MDFSNYKTIVDSYGFEFAKNGIIKSKELKLCMHCGKPTYFIEVCSEGRLCSDECVKAWYDEYSENVGYMDSDILEQEVLEMLGHCCEDETEQCIGCGGCLTDV